MWNVPLLATGIYQFAIESTPAFRPFVGASLGAGIVHGALSVDALGSDSATKAKFQGHLHLGTYLGAQQNVFVDIRLGILSSSFNFAPTIGFRF